MRGSYTIHTLTHRTPPHSDVQTSVSCELMPRLAHLCFNVKSSILRGSYTFERIIQGTLELYAHTLWKVRGSYAKSAKSANFDTHFWKYLKFAFLMGTFESWCNFWLIWLIFGWWLFLLFLFCFLFVLKERSKTLNKRICNIVIRVPWVILLCCTIVEVTESASCTFWEVWEVFCPSFWKSIGVSFSYGVWNFGAKYFPNFPAFFSLLPSHGCLLFSFLNVMYVVFCSLVSLINNTSKIVIFIFYLFSYTTNK